MAVLQGLKPEKVFEYFELLCSVPHGSGNTKQVSDIIAGFAKDHGFRYLQDSLNNVVIFKEATEGYEDAEPVILQGHMDMVCAKAPGCEKDMAKEGLDLCTDGAYVWAEGTSLGGDNCIAVALTMAILDDDTLCHPALECIFTVDEETGMYGAEGLDCTVLRGKKFLNLDSEEEGVFTVSCAGGRNVDAILPAPRTAVTEGVTLGVKISGLTGGHSGCEIEKGRLNASKLMGRVLYQALQNFSSLRLSALSGGKFMNVITPEAEAAVVLSPEEKDGFISFIKKTEAEIRSEVSATEPGLLISVSEEKKVPEAVTREAAEKILYCLFVIPQGVQAMSFDFPGLPQTSLNLGIMELSGDTFTARYFIRSSKTSQGETVAEKIRAILSHEGGETSVNGIFPAWEYRKDSPFRDLLVRVYQDMTGKEAVVMATHGGLECGLFSEKIAGIDAVSLGPELHDIHSEHEKLGVASVGRLYELVAEVLRQSR